MTDPWFNTEEGERDLAMLKGNRLRLDSVVLGTGEELTLFAAGGGLLHGRN